MLNNQLSNRNVTHFWKIEYMNIFNLEKLRLKVIFNNIIDVFKMIQHGAYLKDDFKI
jgi:hypothetical protein